MIRHGIQSHPRRATGCGIVRPGLPEATRSPAIARRSERLFVYGGRWALRTVLPRSIAKGITASQSFRGNSRSRRTVQGGSAPVAVSSQASRNRRRAANGWAWWGSCGAGRTCSELMCPSNRKGHTPAYEFARAAIKVNLGIF